MGYKNFWEVKEPNFVNEEGVKWWLDEDLSKYATRKGLDYQVWLVQKPSGYLTRVILDEKREPIFESQQMELIGFRIDRDKLLASKGIK